MGWETMIKSDTNVDRALDRVKYSYERLISHPDYNRDAVNDPILEMQLNNPILSSALDALEKDSLDYETVIDLIHEDELKRGKKYAIPVRDKDQINAMAVKNWIDWTDKQLAELFRKLSRTRSMGLFESVAKSMGIEIEYNTHGKPTFNHGGLDFIIGGRNELIIDVEYTKVGVCIVSTNPNLPIGDYYASLLGLIVSKPTELDVLHFAIELANILKEYSDYWRQFKVGAYIYTPFFGSNLQNSGFANLIELLFIAEEGATKAEAKPAREMLEKIENTLMDVFGSTRGFL